MNSILDQYKEKTETFQLTTSSGLVMDCTIQHYPYSNNYHVKAVIGHVEYRFSAYSDVDLDQTEVRARGFLQHLAEANHMLLTYYTLELTSFRGDNYYSQDEQSREKSSDIIMIFSHKHSKPRS